LTMPTATFETVRCFHDSRGLVFEPVGAPLLSGQRNVHVVMTEPGAIRGNHLHQRSTEITAVVGPVLVRVREEGQLRDVMVPDGEARRFVIPNGVSHAFQNTGTRPMLLVSFSTEVFDPAHPDVVRDVLI
jgi:dTDP-4-dehydrorhamnose 3,5-epimerase-like enzyme